MKRLATAAIALAALGTFVFAVWKVSPWEARAGSLFPALLLVVLVVSPYLPLAGAAAIARRPLAAGLSLTGTILASLFGFVVYVDAFAPGRENPLHGFLLYAVPVTQWGIALVTLVVVAVVRGPAPVSGSP